MQYASTSSYKYLHRKRERERERERESFFQWGMGCCRIPLFFFVIFFPSFLFNLCWGMTIICCSIVASVTSVALKSDIAWEIRL